VGLETGDTEASYGLPQSPLKNPDISPNHFMAASFHILSYSVFTKRPSIRGCTNFTIDRFLK
jgi:hypothetical protein